MRADVLVADQDLQLAQLFCRYLRDHGLTACAASGGLECLRFIHECHPHVLVLDYELPWGDGHGVLACLREAALPLPVILTTWNPSPQFARRVTSPPVVVCLQKFFPLPDLVTWVRQFHAQPQALVCGAALDGASTPGDGRRATPVSDVEMPIGAGHARRWRVS